MERREAIARVGQFAAALALGAPLRAWQDDRGHRLGSPQLDAHAHLMSRDLASWVRSSSADAEIRRYVRPINGRIIVDALEEDGMPRALALSSACLHASDSGKAGRRKAADEHRNVQNENDFVALQARDYAPSLIPFSSVNPKRDYAIEEMLRCFETHRMRGVSLHFGDSDVRLRDAQHLTRVQKLFAEAAQRNIPVVAHIYNAAVTDFGTADLEIFMGQLVEPFPALRISIAHLGGAGGAAEHGTLRIFAILINARRARPQLAGQVWADCSSVLLTEARPGARPISQPQRVALGGMLREWGLDRLMWGTDAWTDRLPSSLTQARQVWPLGEAEWATLAAFDGAGFLPRSGT